MKVERQMKWNYSLQHVHKPTRFIPQEFSRSIESPSHVIDYYTNSHTPAKLTFGHRLLRPPYNIVEMLETINLIHILIPFRSSVIPFLPLNHPLRLFALSFCVPLALILSLSPFSVRLSHSHFLTENTLALCVRNLPRKYFTFLCRKDTLLLSFPLSI